MNQSSDHGIALGSRKTAILLLSLEQEMAAEVLGKLPREQVEQITLAIANAATVTREEQETVLNEFKTAFASRPLIQPTGPETARELLQLTLDQADVEPMSEPFEVQAKAGAFAYLQDRHPDDIRLLLDLEHPQTIAVVAAQLPADLSAKVLAGYGIERQTDILARLARLGPTNSEILDEMAAMLKERAGRTPVRAGGVAHAAEVLRDTPVATAGSVLQAIEQKDTQLARDLQDSLFSFNDLQLLNDEDLKVVLNETNDCPWAIALRGTSEILRQHLYAAMPAGTAEALREAIRSAGPVRLSEISSVQRLICQTVLKLELQGRLQFSREHFKQGKVEAA